VGKKESGRRPTGPKPEAGRAERFDGVSGGSLQRGTQRSPGGGKTSIGYKKKNPEAQKKITEGREKKKETGVEAGSHSDWNIRQSVGEKPTSWWGVYFVGDTLKGLCKSPKRGDQRQF